MIKLLVVDDDAMVRRMLASVLRADDMRLEFAGDAPDAMTRAELFEPDVVLLDIELNGLSGLDVCRALRAHALPALASTGVILMSGQSTHEAPEATGPVGADHRIGKPFQLQALRALVRQVHRQVLQRRGHK